jgi:hypothetical protein
MRRPLIIYAFATDPFRIYLVHMRKIFFFISVHFNEYLVITDLQFSWDVTVDAAVYSPVEYRAGIGWWGGAQVERPGLSFLHVVRTGNDHFFRSIFKNKDHLPNFSEQL